MRLTLASRVPALSVVFLLGFSSGFADSAEPSGQTKSGKQRAAKAEKAAPKDAAWPQGGSASCQMTPGQRALAGVTEASGIAASLKTPGVLWTHGDSHAGEPLLVAFDDIGTQRGKVRLEGIRVSDWEDIAVAQCGPLSCVYVADIGDNRATRASVAIHRFPEPRPTETSVRVVETFRATYPDGPHDAEAFFVSAGRMFVVTKGETGPIALYALDSNVRPGSTTILRKLAVLRETAAPRTSWITGASASPEGHFVAMRTHRSVLFHETARLIRGDVAAPLVFDVTSLKEPQGEGVALGRAGRLFLAGEASRKGGPGTLHSGQCSLPAPTARSRP